MSPDAASPPEPSAGAQDPGWASCFGAILKAAGVSALVFFGACGIVLWSSMSARSKEYLPLHEVLSDTADDLRPHPTSFLAGNARVSLRWAYLRESWGEPPYELVVAVEPVHEAFRYLEVESVVIRSSAGTSHVLEPEGGWPVRIEADGAYDRGQATLGPAVDLDFDGGERITTVIRVRVFTETSSRVTTNEIEWAPIELKYFVPIV